MLIHEPQAIIPDATTAIILSIAGGNSRGKQLRPGVYEIQHFGGSCFLEHLDHYPETTVGPCGVCDSVEQLLAACPELEAPGRKFVVTVTPVVRSEQPACGGWRWHKWGNYIGTQNPQHEYLYDEPHIDRVLVFHIYERRQIAPIGDNAGR